MDEKSIKSESNWGGRREGAGRPAGSKNKVNKATIQTVIDKLYDRTGQCYEDLLLEDFLQARKDNAALAHKYHSLLANKLMPDLSAVEIDNTEDALTAKLQVFLEVLAKLNEKTPDNK